MSESDFDRAAAEILAKCGRHCCICRRFRPTMLQVHHILEKPQGGTDEADNLIAVCLTCHSDVHSSRPFARRFGVEELKQHRDAVFGMVAEGALVPPADDECRGALVGFSTASGRGDAQSIVIAQGQLISPRLPKEAIEVLVAAAESSSGQVIRVRTSSGLTVQAGKRNLVPSRSPRDEARYKHAVEELSEQGFLDGFGEVLSVTHQGFLLADELMALRERNSATE